MELTPRISASHDDKDILGVCIGPASSYIGLGKFEQHEAMVTAKDGVVWDSVVYELRKFVRLLLGGNPNMMTLLWLPEHLYISSTPAGEKLIANREAFVSRDVGFDVKNAGHLIRLLRMGIEFLSTGELKVAREDATELIEIKRGEKSLAWIEAESNRLFTLAQEAFVHSPLPPKPDAVRAEKLVMEILAERLCKGGTCETKHN